MKRGLLWVALLLSLGFNLGVLASLLRDQPAAPPEAPPAEAAVVSTQAPESESLPSGETPSPAAPAAAPGVGSVPATPSVGTDDTPPAPAVADPPVAQAVTAEPEELAPEAVPPRASGGVPSRQQQADQPPLVDRLGLEGEQRLEFMRLQQELAAKVRAMQPRIERARAELYRELSSEAPDRQRIEQRVVFLGRASAELERAFADTALRSRELLDDEQEQMYLRVLSRRARMVRDGHSPQAPRRDPRSRPLGRSPLR